MRYETAHKSPRAAPRRRQKDEIDRYEMRLRGSGGHVGAVETLAGATAGAAAGALLGPPGMIVGIAAGAAIGAVVGVGAGIAFRAQRDFEQAHESDLDDAIGVTEGSIGEPRYSRPPEIGHLSGASAGIASVQTPGTSSDGGPIPRGTA